MTDAQGVQLPAHLPRQRQQCSTKHPTADPGAQHAPVLLDLTQWWVVVAGSATHTRLGSMDTTTACLGAGGGERGVNSAVDVAQTSNSWLELPRLQQLNLAALQKACKLTPAKLQHTDRTRSLTCAP